MKKILLFIVALIGVPIVSVAQFTYSEMQDSDYEKPSWNEVRGSFIIHAGYNFLEKTPLVGTDLCCNIGYLQGNIEFGWSYITKDVYENKNHFYYVVLAIGPVIGKKNKFYAQIGGVSWVGFLDDDFYSNAWHAKIKAGSDVYLAKKIYLNFELGYIIPNKAEILKSSDMLALRIGLGFAF